MLRKEECLLCHAPLIYLPAQEEMRCALCHTARCENGHYICDACHQKEGLAAIRRMCLASSSKNPMAIAREIMGSPFIHMHGPEHHVLVGACLLAAYANAGGRLDLPAALLEMEHRGSQVPGGICGLWGCCGAAVSAGIYWSIVTEASPLSTKAWRQANELTARCLTAIAKLGGPRCCK
ncbi:MAG: SAM-dependent methyltransferase, partial [Clostridia bacterium]|nr:SAM-dependent methyltransferase [Clostridia bacterium]